ncbi:MAG: efflux RND transporter periplasmic adaptor subunit [Candidatus Omnitrophica bacterium]|nr:efflux RND transporter periplasmic adaptor subunit [Candidatus Omnitrophota bacterium]
MKKSSKALIIGFIALWILVFGLMWAKALVKKGKTSGLDSLKQMVTKMTAKSEAKKTGPEKGPEAGEGGEEQKEAVPVRCYKVAPMDFKDDLPVMGTVKGGLEISLKFEINGVIDSINFREGDMVNKGDIIASLNKKDAQLKVDYAKSKLESAKTQALAAKKKYEINKNLYDIGGIIKAKLEEVELEAKAAGEQAKSAEVELKSAEAEFQKTDLAASREGVLGIREAEAGEFVTPNNKIATLYDIKEVFVELGIVEKDVDKVMLGQNVIVTVDSHSGATFNGKVDYIYPVIEGKSRTLTAKVKLPNPDVQLLPGMFARAMITVAEFSNAIVIPSLSLNKKDEGYTVSVVNEQNKVQIKPVKVEYVTTDYSVVSEGLFEGELVVTETPQELKEDMPVQVIEVQENTSAK